MTSKGRKRSCILLLTVSLMTGSLSQTVFGSSEPEAENELLIPSAVTMAVGFTDHVYAFDGDGGIVDGVVYTSSNPEIAEVAEDGTVTGLAPGEAEITAEKDGLVSNVGTVSVYEYDAERNDESLNTSQYGASFVFGDARTDAPELAHRGDYGVGVREIYTTVEGEVTNPLYAAEEAETVPEGTDYVDPVISLTRAVKIQIYYPADLQGEEELSWLVGYSGISTPGRPSKAWPFAVRAAKNAAPDASGAGESGYPVILLSHGYQGAGSLYTNLETNLASKGYIVVAIDHTGDSKETGALPGTDALSRQARVDDVKAVLDVIEQAAGTEGNFLYGMADPGNTALIGHSLGGYTALGMMGDPRVRAVAVSGPAMTETTEAVIAENPDVPVLMLEGTEDDTVMFADNKEKFRTLLKNNDSYMLVYQGGNHEIIIDGPNYFCNTDEAGETKAFFDSYLDEVWGYWGTPSVENDYSEETVESWHKWREFIFNVEPTWDENHVSNINQHFITAFLGLTLRGEEEMREYLDVPYPIATINSEYGNLYYPYYGEEGFTALPSWKGFQPWTNAGLEIWHNVPEEAAEKAAYAYDSSIEEADLGDPDWADTAEPVPFEMPPFAEGENGFAESYGNELAAEYVEAYQDTADQFNQYLASCQEDEQLSQFSSVAEAAPIDCEAIAEGLFKEYSFDYFRKASEQAFGEDYEAEGRYWINPTVYGPDYVYGDPQTTAPLLAYRGDYGVGVRTIDALTVNGVNADEDGAVYDRPLKLEVWYPAEDEGILEASCTYYDWTGQNPSNDDRPNWSYEKTGRAMRDAEQPVKGKFPVIILSHGVDGSRMLLSYLAENLASKGYVTVCIEHTDSTKLYNSNAMSVANRMNDDTFVIDFMSALSGDENSFLYEVADAENVAVAGYSMGGLGAVGLASSGDPRVKAMIGISPYVDDPVVASGIQVPALYITGTADQTVLHDNVRKMFINSSNVDRYLLTYQNGDHEVGSSVTPWITASDTYVNAASSEGLSGEELSAWQKWREYMFYYEPVWEQGTLNNINQHFVTAFLDKYLKDNAGNGEEYLQAAAASPVYNGNSQSYPWTGFKPYGQSAVEFYSAPAGETGISDLSCIPGGTDPEAELTFTLPEGITGARVLQSADGGYTWTDAAVAEELQEGMTTATVKDLDSSDAFITSYESQPFYQFRIEVTFEDGSTMLSNTAQYYYHK